MRTVTIVIDKNGVAIVELEESQGKGIRDRTAWTRCVVNVERTIRVECFLYIFDVPGVPLGQRSAPACAIPACRKVKKKAPHETRQQLFDVGFHLGPSIQTPKIVQE